MNTKIPPFSVIRDSLKTLNDAGIQTLSILSGVPFTTLLKIRGGITENPRYETVCSFVPHVKQARKARTTASA